MFNRILKKSILDTMVNRTIGGLKNCFLVFILFAVIAADAGCGGRIRQMLPSFAGPSLRIPSGATAGLAPKLNPEQSDYLDKAKDFPLAFAIPAAETPKAWERAREFIERYGTLKLRTADDRVIETILPEASDLDIGYTVIKRPYGDAQYKIAIETQTASRFGGSSTSNKARTNAHLLAYYIATGIIDPALVE